MASDEGIVLFKGVRRTVVRYGDKVVKIRPIPSPWEADTMRFIAAHTSIPVPKVYDEALGPTAGLTMDYIEGKTLETVWKDLSRDEKHDIAAQLRGFLSELHSLRGDYIGALNRGEAIDSRMSDIRGGPFKDETEFNKFLLSNTLGRQLFRSMATDTLTSNHQIVFAHGDFVPRNILVNNGKVVALLDWEFAGWYPEYWDFVKCIDGTGKGIDFIDFAKDIFPKSYTIEYILNSFVGSISRHN